MACGRAHRVVVVTCVDRPAEAWRQKGNTELARLKNLTVIHMAVKDQDALAAFISRTMELKITIDDSQIWLTANDHTAEITIHKWQA